MSTFSPRRTVLIAVLLALVATAALPAQPLTPGVRNASVPFPDSLLARLWSVVVGVFEKEGASLDPSGSNPAPPAPSTGGQGDAGMTIDPDGANVSGGIGVIANPNG
jgi:hypothetical protein